MKVLHVAAECYPLAKTGGLGDVVAALPAALRGSGIDARVALPGYRGLRDQLRDTKAAARFAVGGLWFTVIAGRLHDEAGSLPVLLFECPELFDRGGDPYRDEQGVDFADNALRFGRFCQAVAAFVAGHYPVDVLHLHDWQAGLAAGLLAQQPSRPCVVYTIHNLAYQGHFPLRTCHALNLPEWLLLPEAAEYWGGISFMKAGINLADAITTVSPTYAREVTTPQFGYGLDEVLRQRQQCLHGIVNGIDARTWDPRGDRHLEQAYSEATVATGKRANKRALQAELGLEPSEAPLLAYIGRLAEQKGADLLLHGQRELLDLPVQLVVLATGDVALQESFRAFAAQAPAGRVAVRLLHDERLAHRITAAADLLLMPSRYEPCGLNQMYAQRYGTLPVVRQTGGLADTVVDATPQALADGSASGVLFRDADVGGLLYGVRRGLDLVHDASVRARLQQAGMARDFSWFASARRYLALYESLRVKVDEPLVAETT